LAISKCGGKRIKAKVLLTEARRATADQALQSLLCSARITLMGELDMTEVNKLRKDLVGRASALDTLVTHTDLVIAIVAQSLRKHPAFNASLIGNEIVLWEDINIAVAMPTKDSLARPVVRNADRKSLIEISKEMKSLADRAGCGKLKTEEMTGATFTIASVGAEDSGYYFERLFMNQPESATFCTSGISDRAVVRDGQIVIRPIMTFSLTYDHRVLNGLDANEFVKTLNDLFRNPTHFIL
jgi:pyruvate dehydrogenase E2 component (dihydrolipoamide acetyltransferase)